MRVILILLAIFFSLGLAPSRNDVTKKVVKTCIDNYDKPISNVIYVSINDQKLYLIKNAKLVKTYDVSTSKYGVGNAARSLKTPTGLHYIRSKHGHRVPINGIFKGGEFNDTIAEIQKEPISTGADDVTSRIIWLKGIEKGKNRGPGIDSYQRRIYIHGTPEEGLIGKPASHGCIRMKNKDIVELFKKVDLGLYVLIQ